MVAGVGRKCGIVSCRRSGLNDLYHMQMMERNLIANVRKYIDRIGVFKAIAATEYLKQIQQMAADL